jgi:anti-sigma B factor antagonist
LIKQLLSQGHKRIVFDLSGVTYIDSSGLGMIVYSSASVAAVGGQFALAGAASLPAQLLQVTKLDSIVMLYPSMETACQALGGGQASKGGT